MCQAPAFDARSGAPRSVTSCRRNERYAGNVRRRCRRRAHPRALPPDVVRRIGHGGEAVVYELTGARALRVYRGHPHGAPDIAAFYRTIAAGAKTSFALPEMFGP